MSDSTRRVRCQIFFESISQSFQALENWSIHVWLHLTLANNFRSYSPDLGEREEAHRRAQQYEDILVENIPPLVWE